MIYAYLIATIVMTMNVTAGHCILQKWDFSHICGRSCDPSASAQLLLKYGIKVEYSTSALHYIQSLNVD